MKKLARGLSVVVVLAALLGGIYLVRTSQDTRRSADAGATSISLQPDEIDAGLDDVLTLRIFVNSGADTDKIQGIEAYVNFDRSKLQLLGKDEGGAVVKVGGYDLMTNGQPDPDGFDRPWMDSGSGPLEIKIINTGFDANNPTLGGTHNFLDLKFRTIAEGDANVSFANDDAANNKVTNVYIVGKEEWVIPTRSGSVIKIGDLVGNTSPTVGISPTTGVEPTQGISPTDEPDPTVTLSQNQPSPTVTIVQAQPSPTVTVVQAQPSPTVTVVQAQASPTVTMAPQASNDCVENNDCADNQTCNAGTCEALICQDISGVDMTCRNKTTVAHTCPVITNKQDGLSCGTIQVCKSGECTGITTKSLSFRMAFAGVSSKSKCATDWKVKALVKDSSGNMKTYEDIVLTLEESTAEKNVYKGSVALEGISNTNGLSLFLKGPKHIQVKYGADGQTELYNKDGGELSGGDKIYDFTGYKMKPGDVNQDGVVNALDFSIVKNKSVTHEVVAEGQYLVEDLDGNCIMNTNDVLLLRETLQDKQDQIY